MTLFSALSVGSSGVAASQLGLRVAGNNIANAGTEGFVREEIRVGSLPPVRYGSLSIGTGASAATTVQKIDRYLKERSREASSAFEAMDAQATLFQRMEGVFNELGDNDLSSSLQNFFSSVQEVANNPDDLARRQVVISRATTLAEQIRSQRERLGEMVNDINTEIDNAANEINNSLLSIRDLNVQIIAAEAGTASDAGALRSQRDQELDRLAKLVPIQVHEQHDGSVNVLSDGDFFLFNGTIQEVSAVSDTVNDVEVSRLAFTNSQRAVSTTGGRLGGIQEFRDQDLIAQGIAALEVFANALIQSVNQVHSSGQGLVGQTNIEGTNRVLDPSASLNSFLASNYFTINNGSFQIQVTNATTGQRQTYDINVDLDGVGTDDSLNDVVNRINTVAFGGSPVAVVNAQGRLEFTAPAGRTISFKDDTSGFLAGLGINTFFEGISARDIKVRDEIRQNVALFAASSTGQPGDNGNANDLAALAGQPLDALGGESMEGFVNQVVGFLGSGSENAQTQAAILKNSRDALESENLALTGVSLDEEAVKLITFQRAFQASAQYIRTINELLDEVINLGR